MRAVVVYESMYGNTHRVADAVASGLRSNADVVVVPVTEADGELLAGADLIVVGGPTHAHGLSRKSTRVAAVEAAAKPDKALTVDRDAQGPGLREWFDAMTPMASRAAAFDTRMRGPVSLTGRASKGIAKRLRAHGCRVVVPPESFLVTKENHLLEEEEAHARTWGARLGAAIAGDGPAGRGHLLTHD